PKDPSGPSSPWAASGAPNASSGTSTACTRPRRATRAGSRRTRPTARSAPARPGMPRWCSWSTIRSAWRTRICCASSGRTTIPRRGCGRATTSAPSTAPPSTRPARRRRRPPKHRASNISRRWRRRGTGRFRRRSPPSLHSITPRTTTSSIWRRIPAGIAASVAPACPAPQALVARFAHDEERGARKELIQARNPGNATQISEEREPPAAEPDLLEMLDLEGGRGEDLAELSNRHPVEELPPVGDVAVRIRSAVPCLCIEPVEGWDVRVGVVDVRRGGEERLHREHDVRPGERNDVFEVGAIRPQPGMEVDEELTSGPEDAVALAEHLPRPAEMLDGIDGVHE